MAAPGCLKFCFLCGLRGYHEYRLIWNPAVNEVLVVHPERNNVHDRYAIAAKKTLPGIVRPTIVGHLPREVSRLTFFLILHGARVSCQVVDARYRRSPLIQGGLEIPIETIVEMDACEQNMLAMNKYEALVQEYYKEPVDGVFEDVTASILEGLQSEDDTDSEEL